MLMSSKQKYENTSKMNSSRDMSPIRVLIADDHPLHRKMLSLWFSEEGIVVAGEARDGEEVLHNIEEDEFDVILLDITLPKKDGITVLNELRKLGKKIPVIIVSNYPKEDYESAILSMGASSYVEKGNLKQIIETIKALVATR